MAQDNGQTPAYRPGASPPGESSPFRPRALPRRHRRKPTTTTGRYTPPAHPHAGSGVRPPAVPAVSMCAPAASTGGTSDNLQQTPCHSEPPPPRAVPSPPSCILDLAYPPCAFGSVPGARHPALGVDSVPGTRRNARLMLRKTRPRGSHPVSCILHPASPQCVYAVRQGVAPSRHAPFPSPRENRLPHSGRCRFRRTLRTPGGPPNSLNKYVASSGSATRHSLLTIRP